MTILGLIVFIVIVGVILGGINAFIPMAPMIKGLLNLLIFLLLLVYILQFFDIIRLAILPIPHYFNF